MKSTPAFVLTVLLTAATPAVAANDDLMLQVKIRGASGAGVELSLPLDRLADFVPGAHATLDCDGDADRESRRMMDYLERHGEGAVYRFEDEDGWGSARRRAGSLVIEKRGEDGQTAHVEMPWLLAECFVAGRPVQADIRDLFDRSRRLLVDIRGDDGGLVTISLD